MIDVPVSSQQFWKHPLLNVDYCTEMALNWMEGKKITGVFYNEIEARPGDVVTYGEWIQRVEELPTQETGVTFGIWLAPGRIAITLLNPSCWGKVKPKLLMYRTKMLIDSGRNFQGGVHLG